MQAFMSQLLSDIETFLAEHNLAPSTFGAAALGDRHFVRQLRNGRRVWPPTEEKVRQYMQEYLPGSLPSSGKDQDVTAVQQGRAA